MARDQGLFWEQFEAEMAKPDAREAFLREYARIEAVDRVVNALEERRAALGVSKEELSRHVGRNAASVRRLLTADSPNPRLTTIADMAGALGYRITLEPIPEDEADRYPSPVAGGGRPAA